MKKVSDVVEYMIEWRMPTDYDSSRVLMQLPSPISRDMREIYNYAVRPKGFYLIDFGVDGGVVALALKVFVDEVLRNGYVTKIRRF